MSLCALSVCWSKTRRCSHPCKSAQTRQTPCHSQYLATRNKASCSCVIGFAFLCKSPHVSLHRSNPSRREYQTVWSPRCCLAYLSSHPCNRNCSKCSSSVPVAHSSSSKYSSFSSMKLSIASSHQVPSHNPSALWSISPLRHGQNLHISSPSIFLYPSLLIALYFCNSRLALRKSSASKTFALIVSIWNL